MVNQSGVGMSPEKMPESGVDGGSSSGSQERWWGVKKMSLDEFNDLMTDLHWSRYTQVKIEVVEGDSADLKNKF